MRINWELSLRPLTNGGGGNHEMVSLHSSFPLSQEKEQGGQPEATPLLPGRKEQGGHIRPPPKDRVTSSANCGSVTTQVQRGTCTAPQSVPSFPTPRLSASHAQRCRLLPAQSLAWRDTSCTIWLSAFGSQAPALQRCFPCTHLSALPNSNAGSIHDPGNISSLTQEKAPQLSAQATRLCNGDIGTRKG